MTFVRREIEFVLSYGTGPKGEGPPDVVRLTKHRASVTVDTQGGAGLGQMTARIYGMKASLMNRVSTIGSLPTLQRRNTIAIAAGDSQSGMSLIFEGTITQAWADFSGAPDVAMVITAAAGLIEALLPIPASSYPGAADAATVMADLAAQAGLRFRNFGVSVQLATPYFWGSVGQQIDRCAEAGRFNRLIDRGELIIWNRNGSRGGPVPVISADTGMKGYPSFSATGLFVSSIFNPTIDVGALVEVKSSLQGPGEALLSNADKAQSAAETDPTKKLSFFPVSGNWRVLVVRHDIEAEMPGGKWFTDMQLVAPPLVVLPALR